MLGCASAGSTQVELTSRAGCRVSIFERVPDYAREDIRRVRLYCESKAGCIQLLSDLACQVGGDTVYALEPSLSPARFGPQKRRPALRAIIARRAALDRPVAWSARDLILRDSPGACRPECLKGYGCHQGRCRALCTAKKCASKERCDADGVCRER